MGPDLNPTCQIIIDADPDRKEVSDPGGYGSAEHRAAILETNVPDLVFFSAYLVLLQFRTYRVR